MAPVEFETEDLHNEISALRDKVSRLEQEQAALEREVSAFSTLRSALTHSDNGILLFDTDETILYANDAFADMFGFPGQDLRGQRTTIFDTSQTPASTYAEMRAALEAGRPWHGELCNVDQGEDCHWVYITLTPITAPDGIVTHILGVTEALETRKRAEKALTESEGRYQALADLLPDFVVVHRDGILLYANPATYRVFGGKLDQSYVGRSILDFVHPDARELVTRRMRDLAAGKPIGLREIDYVRVDDVVISAEIASAVIEYDGQPAILSVGRDVTSRKWVEESLRVTEARFRMLIESMQDAVFTTDTEGRFTALYGLPSEVGSVTRYLNKTIGEIVMPEAREVNEAAFRRALAGEPVVYEWGISRLDGTVQTMQISLSPLRDERGTMTGVVGVGRDITELKRAEAALRASEERHRIMLETMPDLIFIMSGDGDYLDIKGAESVRLMKPREELIGRNVRDVLAPEEAEESLKRLRKTLEAGGVQTNQFTLMIDDVRYAFESRMVKSGENEVLSVVSDISDRRQAEQRVLDLALERERVQLLAKFVTNASHEFRTPLSIIGLKAYLLHGDVASAKRDGYLSDILKQVEVLSALIDAMLVMTRIDSQETIERKQMEFATFIAAVCAYMNDQARAANVTLTCDFPGTLPPYYGNMPYLERAFENLVHNAIRHTPAGGTVTVRGAVEAEALVITIQDTGVGMTDDQLARVFERFYRGDQSHSTRGFGLGLPFAKVVFERHGGTIDLRSVPGEGTTVRVTLPLSE